MGVYHDLSGKRVVITGAASGIGLAAAQRFCEEEARVVILDIDREALERSLHDNPALAGGLEADVSEPVAVKTAFRGVDDILGGIDILIANAGISVRKRFLDITYDQWSRVLRVNLDGIFLCAQEAIKRMKEHRSGVVLFTASNNGMEGRPLYSDYNASKAGVINLAKTLALEFAPWLRVNAVCPGYVLTPMQRAEYSDAMLDALNAEIPLQRHAAPEEVAALFAYLASQQAAYITGQAIPIDGGETTGPLMKELLEES